MKLLPCPHLQVEISFNSKKKRALVSPASERKVTWLEPGILVVEWDAFPVTRKQPPRGSTAKRRFIKGAPLKVLELFLLKKASFNIVRLRSKHHLPSQPADGCTSIWDRCIRHIWHFIMWSYCWSGEKFGFFIGSQMSGSAALMSFWWYKNVKSELS